MILAFTEADRWRPGIGDPTFMGWLTVVAYFTASLLCCMAGRSDQRAHPLDFRVTNAAQRVAETGDRWSDALKRKQSLEGVLNGAKA